MGGRGINRRAFLAGTGALTVAAWSGILWSPERARALHQLATDATVANPAGTSLESTIVFANQSGFRHLTDGPGWPTVVRAELATPTSGRADHRRPIAAFAHLTDIHLVDVQSPGRVEFIDRYGEPLTAAFRPHEALSAHVASSMVQRINQIGRGPITGRRLDCAISTGDNIDNMQTNEADWFVRLLDGGLVTANSGQTGVYEGVQDDALVHPTYWHPEPGISDDFKTLHAFPDRPGLLDAAIVPFTSPALAMPWYSTYGNHDSLVQGNLPVDPGSPVDDLMVHHRKITELQPGQSWGAFIVAMFQHPDQILADLNAGAYPFRDVTPDPGRITIKPKEWVQLHLDSPAVPGPIGHGYTESHLDLPEMYYDFPVAPGVRGISLDTGGGSAGSLGQVQVDWLEATLVGLHSRYVDRAGTTVRTDHADELVVLFSHFGPATMTGSSDPKHPDEARYTGDAVIDLLHRFPNVVAWVNGHTHCNTIVPRVDPSGRTGGFWDITTASHIDYPEHARLVELTDNRDGTLSIFTTMIEHLAPAVTDPLDHSVLGLASISRELAANDPQSDLAARLGTPVDLNVELVLAAPFDLTDLGLTTTTTTTTVPAATAAQPVAASPAFTG